MTSFKRQKLNHKLEPTQEDSVIVSATTAAPTAAHTASVEAPASVEPFASAASTESQATIIENASAIDSPAQTLVSAKPLLPASDHEFEKGIKPNIKPTDKPTDTWENPPKWLEEWSAGKRAGPTEYSIVNMLQEVGPPIRMRIEHGPPYRTYRLSPKVEAPKFPGPNVLPAQTSTSTTLSHPTRTAPNITLIADSTGSTIPHPTVPPPTGTANAKKEIDAKKEVDSKKEVHAPFGPRNSKEKDKALDLDSPSKTPQMTQASASSTN